MKVNIYFIIIIIFFIITAILFLRRFYPIKKLTKEESKELYDIASRSDKFLRENNINYFITCGTLLGAVRHEELIPHDKDIDIAMFEEDFQKLKNLEDLDKKLEKYGLSLEYRDHIWRLEKKVKKGMYIDVFLYKKFGDLYHYVEEKNRYRWPKEFVYYDEIFPLRDINFGNLVLSSPKNHHALLKRYYGSDYMTPYHYGHVDDYLDMVISYGGRKV